MWAGVLALFPSNLNTWYGLPAQGIAVDDWADDNFDHSGLDFVGGGNLWVSTERPPILAASMNTFGRAPRWGSTWKAFIKENADRWTGCYIQKTTLPYEDNYLDLHPTVLLQPNGHGSSLPSRTARSRTPIGGRVSGRRPAAAAPW